MSNKQGRKQLSNQFQKGVSGNPAGRPKGAKSKTTLMKEGMEADWLSFLYDKDPSVTDKVSRWNNLMEVVYQSALAGDRTSQRFIVSEVQKDIRQHNAEQAKAGTGPQKVSINIKTTSPPELKEVIGEIIEQQEID